jgi:hypothetical protein
MRWLTKPTTVRATLLACLIAGAIGFAVEAFVTRHRLRINSSDLSEAVWEWRTQPLAQPPECRPRSSNGIGAWQCRVMYADVEVTTTPKPPPGDPSPPSGSAPPAAIEDFNVEVSASGAVTGRSVQTGQGFTTCCLDVR